MMGMAMRTRKHTLWLGLASAAALPACDLGDILGNPELNLSGQNAFVHLQADNTRAQAVNMQAVFQVVEWEAEGGSSMDDPNRFEPDTETLDFLQATARARENIQPENFDLVPVDQFAALGVGDPDNKAVFTSPDLNGLQNEYVVPRLDAIPVRNQGSRGTCAAFTGIAHIEYAVLSQYPDLGTIDLSEQRFYYNSKPECQTSGCNSSSAGSWYGTGMQASVSSSTFDIPLEADCPYNSSQDNSNELQVPLSAGCSDGAVRIAEYELVYQPDEIIRILEEEGLPVPFASPLSDNWFQNNGLITLAAAGSAGNVMHAAGHAYLIVGYKLLPNMPEEGGMCFLIKNSWGTGWGAAGYSCMTLAWMEEWNYGYALDQPVVVQMEVREDLIADSNREDDSDPDFIDEDTYDDETVDYDELDDDTPIPDPEPVPNELVFVEGSLAGPDGRVYRAQVAERDGAVHIRGEVRETDQFSNPVVLTRSGNMLVYDGDEVGEINGTDVTVCAGRFDLICSLRYKRRTNDLYVEFLYDEYRRVEGLSDSNWQTLFSVPAGATLQILRPESLLDALLSPLFVRLGNRSDRSDPIRVSVNRQLELTVMDRPIGSLRPDNLALCNNDYKGSCSLFVGRNGLLVLPGWGGL
jgi:hypothetical protein